MITKIQGVIRSNYNLIVGIGVKFIAVGIGVLINRFINNTLTSEEYATFNYALSLSPVVISFIELGITSIISKYYTIEGDSEKKEYIWINVNIIRFFTYFLGIAAIALSGIFIDHKDLLIVCMLFSAQFILFADQNFRGVTATLNKNIAFSLTDLLGKTLLFIFLLFITLFSVDRLLYVSSALIIAYLGTYIADTIVNLKHISWKFHLFDRLFIKKYYSMMIYLGLFSMMIGLYNTMDRVILANYVNENAFNGYNNAYRIFEVATLIPGISYPVIASKIKQAEIQGKHVLSKYLRYSNIVAIGVTFLFIVLAPLGLLVIDNTRLYYDFSFQIYWIIGLSLLFISHIGILNQLILFEHKEKQLFIIHAIIAIFALCLYFATIPFFGIYGAAISSLIVYLFDALIKSIYYFRIRNNN